MDIDLVLTGPGALSDGVTQGLWEEVLPKYEAALPDLETLFTPGARMMQENFGRGQGIAVAYLNLSRPRLLSLRMGEIRFASDV